MCKIESSWRIVRETHCITISLNYRGNCVIDGILGSTCFYAMDLLQMNDNEYDDSEAESRLFLLSSRVSF